LDLIKADFAEAMVFDIKRFEFFWSRVLKEQSEHAAHPAHFPTGSEVLRQIQTDTKGASPMGVLDIKSGSHRLGSFK
jgi:hypothetical protein